MTFSTYNITLHAEDEWYDTGITISDSTHLMNFKATGTVYPWTSSPPAIGPNGVSSPSTKDPHTHVQIIGKPFGMLIGRIGTTGKPFPIGSRSTTAHKGSGHLYLTINDVIGGYSDNSGVFSVTVEVGELGATNNEVPGGSGCGVAYNYNTVLTNAPISLADGEKREEVTDLTVMTPAGALQFTRTYRQSKQSGPDYQFMGLGWTHNHLGKLSLDGTSPNRTASVLIPGGGLLPMTEDSGNADHFEAGAGSFSTMDYDSGEDEFILTLQDKSTLVFDGTNLTLKRRSWPNGESWTYAYSSGRLSTVTDDYGRGLQFAYVYNPSQYDADQLWRVGDHNTTNLDNTTPTGRYVEFGYLPEASNHTPITNAKALLTEVTDVRGNSWLYDWYGQNTFESDPDYLNLLLGVSSPEVDMDGDGSLDDRILLKRLSYVLSSGTVESITQERGIQGSDPALLETLFEFDTNITVETTAEGVTVHRFPGGVYGGASGPHGTQRWQWLGLNYRPETQEDGNGNATQLTWSEDGKQLQEVLDAVGNTTSFSYNTSGASADTLQESLDAQGRRTAYSYDDSSNPRLPTRIQVFDSDTITILSWREFTYDSKGRTLTEQVLDPADGTTVLQQITRTYGSSGSGEGLLESVTRVDPVDSGNNTTTTYTYDEVGRVIKTQQTSLFGTCEFSYTVYDEAGNVVATVCGPQNTTPPATVEDAIDLYTGNHDNLVTVYGYDPLGRRVQVTSHAGAGFPIEQTTLTVYDALDRVIRTIQNYVEDVGVPSPYTADLGDFDHGTNNDQNLVTDTAYNARGMVRAQTDMLGHVTLFGYEDETGRLIKTIQNASDPDYNNDYVGSGADAELASYEPVEDADQDIITTQTYDDTGNLIQAVDALGGIAYTAYDNLNRPVSTIRAAKDSATIDLNPGDGGYDADNDPRWEGYAPSTDPDRDLTSTSEYDALGRVIRTRQLLENRAVVQWETTLFGYDSLGRQVKVIRNASQPEYDLTADPDLSEYPTNAAPDADILTQTFYDVSGRVLYTEDALGVQIRPVYDGLGRQVMTIANYVEQGSSDPADWEWSETNTRWEDGASNAISFGSDNDQNIITATEYDSDGRVLQTRDGLGRINRSVYDSRGRLFRSITNYVAQSTTDPFDWVWNDSNHRWEYGSANTTPISHGGDNDENVISETSYDELERVAQTLDNRYNAVQVVYDALGRRVMTITNYVEQGSSDPADWEWSNSQWEDGASNAITFGSDNDQNRISAIVYDLAGRVCASRDAAGVETRFVYDGLGRQVMTIANYIEQGTSDPADWEWSNSQWEDGASNAIAFGSDNDQNRISTTIFNKAGQVMSTRDAHGTQTAFTYDKAGRRLTTEQAVDTALATTHYTCYDKAGRVLRTIANWSDDPMAASPDAQESDGSWSWVPSDHGSDNDTDLITEFHYDRAGRRVRVVDSLGYETLTVYNKTGQVIWMTDPEYTQTSYRYDGLRRRTRVVQGYLPVAADPQIAFRTNRDGDYEIYVMDDTGSNLVNLTDDSPGDDTYLSWSPDGSQIAFISNRSSVRDLYVMDADGSNPQRLPTTLNSDNFWYPDEPAWSPDGGRMAFTVQQIDISRFVLAVVNADGSNLQIVYQNTGMNAGGASWSPDGQRLAFHAASSLSTGGDVYVMKADGTQLVNLTNASSELNQFPAWSPDGSKIAFLSKRDGNREIYVMNADGSNPVNLTAYSGADDFVPSWSPDGSQIAFHSNRDGDSEIFVMNADGSGVTQLTSNAVSDAVARWSPAVIDPAEWEWSAGNSRWEDGAGHVLPHGTYNDRNIIVDVVYDLAGRVVSQREPRGNETAFAYDQLNRRLSRTNPLSKTWETAYTDLSGGGTHLALTYPGVNGGSSYTVEQDFDRLGRLLSIQYGDPSNTPDVKLHYDSAGNRAQVTQYTGAAFTSPIRDIFYEFDAAHRLATLNADADADSTIDISIDYEYDLNGRRTKLTVSDGTEIDYTYDERGQLVSLTDWDDQTSDFGYDLAGRHISTERPNGFDSAYSYDAAGRLRQLRHTAASGKVLGHFAYMLDRQGNRLHALEAIPNPATTTDTTLNYDDVRVVYGGTWAASGGFNETTDTSAILKLMFFGDAATLSIGEGSDHSQFELYLDDVLLQTVDGYAASAAQRNIAITPSDQGPHILEIRNLNQKNVSSSGYKLRFKQLVIADLTYTLHNLVYSYDALSRLVDATYQLPLNDQVAALAYSYTYDRSGNRTQQVVSPLGGSPTTTNWSYNAANQMTSDGTYSYGYDNNGNLTTAASFTIGTWDRANRLLSSTDGVTTTQYAYTGTGERVQKNVGGTVYDYLLDVQPGLAVVLGQYQGSSYTRFAHGPRGLLGQGDLSSNWKWMVPDGLGSVRTVTDDTPAVLESRNYEPYGKMLPYGSGSVGSNQTPYGFTGEQTDAHDAIYLRARYYNAPTGTFISLDPFEGMLDRAMSLNGYGWVEGNVVNRIDPEGNCYKFADGRVSSDSERYACGQQRKILRETFGITTSRTKGLPNNAWTVDRIQNLYDAVNTISGALDGLTRQAIGDTNIVLGEQSPGAEAATTSSCNKIYLYLNYTDTDGTKYSNWIATVNNIIHEFGHLLTLGNVGRTKGSEQVGTSADMEYRPVVLWDQVHNYMTFLEDDGWNTSSRESHLDVASEVVADMFLYWVKGFGFSNNTIGNARSAFMNGGDILDSKGNVLTRVDKTPIKSAGVQVWAQRASCGATTAADADDVILVDYPEVILANNGWCTTLV